MKHGGVMAKDLLDCRKYACVSRRCLCHGSQQKCHYFSGFRASPADAQTRCSDAFSA